MSNAEDNEDEFDSIFDDGQLLDPELEQSLAQVEATYTASQPQHPTSSTRATTLSSNSAVGTGSHAVAAERPKKPNQRGVFVPPFKKQRIDAGPSIHPSLAFTNAAHGSRLRRFREPETDEVIVRNLRDEEFVDQEDESWWATNQNLDQMEQDAIRSSQQLNSAHTESSQHPLPALNDEARPSSSQHCYGAYPNAPVDGAAPKPATSNSDEIQQLREEIERLRQLQASHDEMVDKLKQEAYRKSGEVAVVRQNLTKLNVENAKLREREVAREHEHKAALDRIQAENQRQLENLETAVAFRRVEQDTSRRTWPSSVKRVPPAGLREIDRRQESQVRAGLTSPSRSARGSSGSRQRYVAPGAQREEPGTPTKAATKSKQISKPISVNKGKAFKGLQNSFADFRPVQDKLRHRLESPSKGRPDQDTLPAADWMSQDHQHHQDDVVIMQDQDPPQPGAKNMAVEASSDEATVQPHEKRYLSAIAEMLRRRTMLVSYMLCHTVDPRPDLIQHPTDQSSSPVKPTPTKEGGEESTLHRLLSTRFPSDCPLPLVFRYRRAIETILTSLGGAPVMEQRELNDAMQLLHTNGAEEIDFSCATLDMSFAVASAMLTMAGVLLRTRQMDRLIDVLLLISALASNVPLFATGLLVAQPSTSTEATEDVHMSDTKADDPLPKEGLTTPRTMMDLLLDCIMECQPHESKASDATADDSHITLEIRESLLEAVVQLLEPLSLIRRNNPDLPEPLSLFQRPGVLHILLHKDLSPTTLYRVIRLLAFKISDSPFIHECLASRPLHSESSTISGSSVNGVRTKAKFPILEVLVKHLVDRRFDHCEDDWHALHQVILIFLTQAALRSADTLTVLADSAALLAALIRCLSLDSDFVWCESRPSFLLPGRMTTYKKQRSKSPHIDETRGSLLQATERIVMDVRLLNLLYNYPLPLNPDTDRFTVNPKERMVSISLASKLDQPETYSMLNGIRQSFVVALSRIAFNPEPEWIIDERKFLRAVLPRLGAKQETAKQEAEKQIGDFDRVSLLLESIAEVAGDLIEIVLSPEEIDSIYDLLATEEDEDVEENEYVEDEELANMHFADSRSHYHTTEPDGDEIMPESHTNGTAARIPDPSDSDTQEEAEDHASTSRSPKKGATSPAKRAGSSKATEAEAAAPNAESRKTKPSRGKKDDERAEVVVIDDSD